MCVTVQHPIRVRLEKASSLLVQSEEVRHDRRSRCWVQTFVTKAVDAEFSRWASEDGIVSGLDAGAIGGSWLACGVCGMVV